jgi:magnesium chelatase subunit I
MLTEQPKQMTEEEIQARWERATEESDEPKTSELLDLLVKKSVAKRVIESYYREGDLGLADTTRFPFMAIVGQPEMKVALLLGLINRHIGGVLLIGPRGTGKTTAVRGLTELLPTVRRSRCPEGCEEDAARLDEMTVCANCREKYRRGEPLTSPDTMRLIELPLNARLEDVVGGIDERHVQERNKVALQRGILSQSDRNLLYIDEINLLETSIVDAILDAAAQGIFTVRRGPMAATYNARIFLVGSMNPEEGPLRPQLQDRFGLRVMVRAVDGLEDRLELYRRSVAYRENPYQSVADWRYETELAALDIQEARDLLPQVGFEPGTEKVGLHWIHQLNIQSHRAEITLFETARAYAALDKRTSTTIDDLRVVAPLVLRQRQSHFIDEYLKLQAQEDHAILEVISKALP